MLNINELPKCVCFEYLKKYSLNDFKRFSEDVLS